MKNILFLAFALILLNSCGDPEVKLAEKADKIHEKILTVDTHCDTPLRMMRADFDLGTRNDNGCVDFPRMVEGGLDAEFFAVYLGQGDRTPEAFELVWDETNMIFDKLLANLKLNEAQAQIARTADDAYAIKKVGKRVAFIGVENGYPIGLDINKVKTLYDLGARYITLCHSKNNDICDSSTDPKGPEHDGLSDFGKEVVAEMNRLGMMIDVSHISDKSFYDVLEVSKSPIIASHSSARALCESPRNLNDEMLMALKSNGGVIQICILSNYLKQPEPNPELESKVNEIREKYRSMENMNDSLQMAMRVEIWETRQALEKKANVSDAVDHIDHVVNLIGIDYVGIGTDFDGGGGINGCSNASEMKNITIELLRRGYTKAQIEKIWGGNAMRVLRQNEIVAKTL